MVLNWLKGLIPEPVTRHNDEIIDLTLPGKWRTDHEENHLDFVSDASGEQVTLNALLTRDRLDQPALLVTVLNLVAVRQKAFRDLSGPGVQFSEIETQYVEEGVEVAFTFADTAFPVQGRVTIIGRAGHVVTFSYNKYKPIPSTATFLGRSAELRSGLRVKG